jgi:hypothetical protein
VSLDKLTIGVYDLLGYPSSNGGMALGASRVEPAERLWDS